MPNKITRIDKEERTYFVDALDMELPSVTTIIGQLDKSGPLMGWAVKVMGEYLQAHPEELKDNPADTYKKAKGWYKELSRQAMDLGSEIHNLLEVHLKGQKVEGLLEANPLLNKPFEEFLAWKGTRKFELVESEHIVWSHLKYAGTLDCVAKLDGKLYLADFKSSKAIYDDYLMQVAAYMKAYEERINDGHVIDRKVEGVGILRLPKTEKDTFEWKEYTLTEVEDAFESFMCLVSYWWSKKRS